MNDRLLLMACAVVVVLAVETGRQFVQLERAARRAKVGGGGSERSVRNLHAPSTAVVPPAGDTGAGGPSVAVGPGESDPARAFARLASVHDDEVVR